MRRATFIGLICICAAGLASAQERLNPVADGAQRPQSERSSKSRFGAAADSTAPVDFQVYRAQNPATDLGNSLNLLFRDRKDVVVVPDALSNTLLIRADEQMLQRITDALHELDRRPRTVQFEIYLLDFQTAIDRQVTRDADAGAKHPPASSELKGAAEQAFAVIGDWEQQGRVKVLNHFELAAVDNNPSRIQFGAKKPRVTGAQFSGRGNAGGPWGSTSVTMDNVGTVVAVTSRVDSDGRIVAEVDFEKTFLGSDEEGKVIAEVEGRDKVIAPSTTTLSVKQTIQLTSGTALPIAAAAGKSDASEPGRFLIVVAATVEDGK